MNINRLKHINCSAKPNLSAASPVLVLLCRTSAERVLLVYAVPTAPAPSNCTKKEPRSNAIKSGVTNRAEHQSVRRLWLSGGVTYHKIRPNVA
jgi:hypothetical protein